MLTEEDKALLRVYSNTQALLEPLRRITEDWSVVVRHKFQDRISKLQLIGTGNLENDWTVSVRAAEGGVIVAEFAFPEYGRLFDMRRVNYQYPPPAEEIEAWVKNKISTGRIKYSKLADRLGVSFSNPRVIHDITFRILRSNKFKLPIRRWYNKGKEASVSDLYDQLQEAMQEAVLVSMRADFKQEAA